MPIAKVIDCLPAFAPSAHGVSLMRGVTPGEIRDPADVPTTWFGQVDNVHMRPSPKSEENAAGLFVARHYLPELKKPFHHSALCDDISITTVAPDYLLRHAGQESSGVGSWSFTALLIGRSKISVRSLGLGRPLHQSSSIWVASTAPLADAVTGNGM